VHALDVGLVDAPRRVVRTAGVEEEQAACVLARAEQAFALGIDVDAAARVAGADEVRVAVPQLLRIEPFPRGADELVRRQAARQPRAARIDEALFGPVAPGGETGRSRGSAGGA
jgi:hypothetical protein